MNNLNSGRKCKFRGLYPGLATEPELLLAKEVRLRGRNSTSPAWGSRSRASIVWRYPRSLDGTVDALIDEGAGNLPIGRRGWAVAREAYEANSETYRQSLSTIVELLMMAERDLLSAR